MLDPRDDARDREGREDGRERVYDERDRDDDPREGLMRDLELRAGRARAGRGPCLSPPIFSDWRGS